MSALGKSQIKSQRLEAVIIRADGTRESLGTIAYYHKSWFIRAWYSAAVHIQKLLKKL